MHQLYKVLLCFLINVSAIFTSAGAITNSPNTVVVGCSDTFTTSISGTFYQWNFGPNAYPSTIEGTVPTAAASFLTSGVHTIRVLITTADGIVGDSLTVSVQASNDTVSLTSKIPVCQDVNTPVTFTASPGGYQEYAFFVNDSLMQFTTSNTFKFEVVAGDSFRVFGYNGICFTNPSNTLYDHTPPPPILTSSLPSGDTICAGDTIVFTASPAVPGDSFMFFIGGSLQQHDSMNTWSTRELGDSSEITAFVINQYGCRNYYYSNTILVRVKPSPEVNIEAAPLFCAGDSVEVTAIASQAPADTFYLYVNSILQQISSDSVFIYAGLHNNDTVSVAGSLQGCISRVSDPVIVHTGDSASITVFGFNPICQGDTDQFTATPVLGGNNPRFQWTVNGQNVGSNSTVFITGSLNNNDTVVCAMTSSASCVHPATVYSAPIIMAVGHVYPPPTITVSNDTLTSSLGTLCNWYLNGNYFTYTQTPQLVAPVSGYYQVVPIDYCTNISDSVLVSLNCGAYFVIYPDSTPDVYYGYNQSTGTNLRYLWYFGDGDTSSEEFPVHQYDQPGQYNVCLTVFGDSNCESTFCDSSFYVFKTAGGLMDKLIILGPTGIANIPTENIEVNIFPNPATDKLYFSSSKGFRAEWITVYAMNGEKLIAQSFAKQIDITALPAGVYFIEVTGGNEVMRSKVVKM